MMNNDIPSENTIKSLVEIQKRLRDSFNILRDDLLVDEFRVVFYLLTFYRISASKGLKFGNKNEFIDQINSNLFNLKDNVTHLHDDFIPLVKRIDNYAFNDLSNLFHSINTNVLEKYFSELFDGLLYDYSNLKGKFGSEYIQPIELSRFLCKLIELPKDANVYNPFAGLASFGVFLNKEVNYFGQEMNQSICSIGTLRLLAYNRSNSSILTQGNSTENWNPQGKMFDLIISHPPFGMKKGFEFGTKSGKVRTFENFFIQRGIEDLKPNGKLIAVVTHGILFRGGTEEHLRQNLINCDLLEMVISLPSGILQNTAIPLAILIINRGKKDKGAVVFIDAKNCIQKSSLKEMKLDEKSLLSLINISKNKESYRLVSNETIISQDYNLNVPRYFQKETKGVKLRELVNEIYGQQHIEKNGKLIELKNLKNHKFDYLLDINSLVQTEIDKASRKISESCLLITIKGESLRPTYFEYNGESIFIPLEMIALKVNVEKIDLGFLINELFSENVTQQINNVRTGNIISKITVKDLLDVKIDILFSDYTPSIASLALGPIGAVIGGAKALYDFATLEKQKSKIQGVREQYNQFQELKLIKEKELLGFKDDAFRDFASFKHTFRQYLGALKSNALGTTEFFLKMEGQNIDLNSIYSKNINQTLGDHFSSLNAKIDSMTKLLQSFDEQSNVSNSKEYNLEKLIYAAQSRFENIKIFHFEKLFIDKESFQMFDGNYIAPNINIDEEDFYTIFLNIVSNAIDHGFKNTTKKYIIRTTLSLDYDDKLCTVEISNNGLPMPNNFTQKEITTRGEKTTDSKGVGIGGADIKKFIDKYNGVLEIKNIEADEFPVSYIIKFPLATINL